MFLFCRTLTAADVRRADLSVESNQLIPTNIKQKLSLDLNAQVLTYKHLALVTHSATQALPLRIINMNTKHVLQELGIRHYDSYFARPFLSRSKHSLVSMTQWRNLCVVLVKFEGKHPEVFGPPEDGDLLVAILIRLDKIRNCQHDLFDAGAERIAIMPGKVFPDKRNGLTRYNSAVRVYNDRMFVLNVNTKFSATGDVKGMYMHGPLREFMEAKEKLSSVNAVGWKVTYLGLMYPPGVKQVYLYSQNVKRSEFEERFVLLAPCCDQGVCEDPRKGH